MTREEAINRLRNMTIEVSDYCNASKHMSEADRQDMETFDMAIKALEQEPRWIPVSERLPEEDGEYLVTIYDADENYKYIDIAELADGIWQYKDYIKVLAWMPSPEPYTKSEVEE